MVHAPLSGDCVPAGHAWHSVPTNSSPGPQYIQSVFWALGTCPEGHVVQVPLSGDTLPLVQFWQYVPSYSVPGPQIPLHSSVVHSKHWKVFVVVYDAKRYPFHPEGQLLHAVLPDPCAYVPWEHLVHSAVATVFENLPGGQVAHPIIVTRFCVEYSPAGHAEHSAELSSLSYPLGHILQSLISYSPRGQLHSYEPAVFVQIAPVEHGESSHSLISSHVFAVPAYPEGQSCTQENPSGERMVPFKQSIQ